MLPRAREIIKAIAELSKEATPVTIKAISRKTRIPRSEVQYFLGRLEDGDYIERVEERTRMNGDPFHGYRLILQGYRLRPRAEELLTYLT